MSIMRAKFKITQVTKFETAEQLAMQAVSKSTAYPSDGTDEDNSFALWTPSASLTMTINNPNLLNKFEVGQKFYVDFTQAV